MSIKNGRPNKGKGGRIAVHSESFKVQVALDYLHGNYSCPQVAEKYHLATKTVEYFVSWYRKNHQQVMPEESAAPEHESLQPVEEKELEKRLALAEMKIAALEKVIAIANEEYGTDLKKKAATK